MHPDITTLFQQIQKEDNFISKAKLIRFLVVDKQVRIKDVAKGIGMKESYVCHILRLNKLSDMVLDGYYSKLISISHLFIISRLHTQEDIAKAYESILTHNLTVASTEEMVREMLYHTKTVGAHLAPDEASGAKEKLKTEYNAKLQIVQTRVKSKCIIEIPGSLAETTPTLRVMLKKLTERKSDASVEEITS